MFKKTKVRSILELLGKNLSAREVSRVLGVSRNTVAEVQALFVQSGKSWDDISLNISPDMHRFIILMSIGN